MFEKVVALTIAGSDSGGGAGIQADLKTFSALGIYGTSVITAITAQNLDGVYAIQGVDPDIVKKQLIAVLKGFPVRAIKTGMLYCREIIEIIAHTLNDYKKIPLIIDPVFVSTSGIKLIKDDAIESLKKRLFPLANLVTPNMQEAEILLEADLKGVHDLEEAAEKLFDIYKVPFLIKGGHLKDSAIDVLYDNKGKKKFSSELVKKVNNHGSGCTFSSAITSNIVKGYNLRQAISKAKEYIYYSLKYSHNISEFNNVINHFWEIDKNK